MNIVTTWIVYIFLILFFGMIVVFNVARVVYFIKCFKIKDCTKKSCHFKIFCYKYYEEYTDEVRAKVMKLLEEGERIQAEKEKERQKELENKEDEKNKKDRKRKKNKT